MYRNQALNFKKVNNICSGDWPNMYVQPGKISEICIKIFSLHSQKSVFPGTFKIHRIVYNKWEITHIKLQLPQCYHMFSNTRHIYLPKKHSEHSPPRLIPMSPKSGPGWWTILSLMQDESVVMALVRDGLIICETARRIGGSKAGVKAWVCLVMFTSRRFFCADCVSTG